MSDATARLQEAESVLHQLEIQVEQHRIHFEELIGQPHEAQKAETVLGEDGLEAPSCSARTAISSGMLCVRKRSTDSRRNVQGDEGS